MFSSCVAYNPYHKHHLLSSDYEGSVCVWDTNIGQRTRLHKVLLHVMCTAHAKIKFPLCHCNRRYSLAMVLLCRRTMAYKPLHCSIATLQPQLWRCCCIKPTGVARKQSLRCAAPPANLDIGETERARGSALLLSNVTETLQTPKDVLREPAYSL